MLDIHEPFLFIDQVFDVIPGKQSSSISKINKNDWFFKYHLPSQGSCMPGVLITEIMLQTTVIAIYENLTSDTCKKGFVYSFDVKLMNPISPKEETQTLMTHSKIHSTKRGISKCDAVIYHENNIIASSSIVHAIPQL